jgi:hypothetical protein
MIQYPFDLFLDYFLRHIRPTFFPPYLELLLTACNPLLGCFVLYIELSRLNYIKIRRITWPNHLYDLLKVVDSLLVVGSVGRRIILLNNSLPPACFTLFSKG